MREGEGRVEKKVEMTGAGRQGVDGVDGYCNACFQLVNK